MQAEAADPAYSRRVEALSWSLVSRFAPQGEGPRESDPDQVRALFLVQELDRLAYLVVVRGWQVDRDAAIRALAAHWYAFLAR